MEIKPVAFFKSALPEKFGIPRQAGLADKLRGQVVLEPGYNSPEALRGMEGFDFIWLIWGFNLNHGQTSKHLTVRPPRLGGNERIGVFASRSPFRPNPLGLSSVRIESVDPAAGIINVLGADLADGTPIYDIKPYVTYTDSHPEAASGFVDSRIWEKLEVSVPEEFAGLFKDDELEALIQILSEDPRPQYHDDAEKTYGLLYAGRDVKFIVKVPFLFVVGVE